MKKNLLFFVSIFLLFSCDKVVSEKEKPEVKIGIQLPLSGDASSAGESSKQAIVLEMDKLLEKELKYDYKLIFEDVQLSPARSALASNKMIAVDKVKAIISVWSIAGNVASAIANENKILNFGCSYGEQSTKGKFNFNVNNDFVEVSDMLAKELLKNNINKVALVVEVVGGIPELVEAVEKTFADNGIEIVFNEGVVFGEKNFRFLIEKIKATNPQKVIDVGTIPHPFLFLKQWQESGGDKSLVTTFDGYLEMPQNQRYMAEGLWFLDGNNIGNEEYAKEYFEKTGKDPLSCSGSAATSLKILVDAFENAELEEGENIPNNDNIVKWIWQNLKNYNYPVGDVNIINEGLIAIKPSFKMIKDGEVIELKEERI